MYVHAFVRISQSLWLELQSGGLEGTNFSFLEIGENRPMLTLYMQLISEPRSIRPVFRCFRSCSFIVEELRHQTYSGVWRIGITHYIKFIEYGTNC